MSQDFFLVPPPPPSRDEGGGAREVDIQAPRHLRGGGCEQPTNAPRRKMLNKPSGGGVHLLKSPRGEGGVRGGV